jgi:hypothetical protein
MRLLLVVAGSGCSKPCLKHAHQCYPQVLKGLASVTEHACAAPPRQVPMTDFKLVSDDVASSQPSHHEEHAGMLDSLMAAAAAVVSFIGTGQTHPPQEPHDTDLPAGGMYADTTARIEQILPAWLSVDRIEAAARTGLHRADTATAHAHSSVTHANLSGSGLAVPRPDPLTVADLDQLRALRYKQRAARLQLLVPMVEKAGPPAPLDFKRCASSAVSAVCCAPGRACSTAMLAGHRTCVLQVTQQSGLL